jgi:hypothetical protein
MSSSASPALAAVPFPRRPGAPKGNRNALGHGAPRGNHNARGHGAPRGNRNAWKFGIYSLEFDLPDIPPSNSALEIIQAEQQRLRLLICSTLAATMPPSRDVKTMLAASRAAVIAVGRLLHLRRLYTEVLFLLSRQPPASALELFVCSSFDPLSSQEQTTSPARASQPTFAGQPLPGRVSKRFPAHLSLSPPTQLDDIFHGAIL